MKCVFYKRLLLSNKKLVLSPCEKIVYSNLFYHAICFIWGEVIDKDDNNKFDEVLLEEQGDSLELPFYMFNKSGKFWYANKMSTYCGISQSSISSAFESLAYYGIIDIKKKTIKHNNIYKEGFFEIKQELNLEAALLIFTSWLYKLKGKDKHIYANNKKLAALYYTTEQTIANYIFRLKKLGYAERDKSKRLILLKQ